MEPPPRSDRMHIQHRHKKRNAIDNRLLAQSIDAAQTNIGRSPAHIETDDLRQPRPLRRLGDANGRPPPAPT